MNEKRFKKLNPLRHREDLFRIEGDRDAPLALVSWGSTAGVCREALRLARAENLKAKLLVPYLLFPVAEQIYERFFESVQAGLLVEQSHQGQLYRILRMHLDLPKGLRSFCRTGANPFRPTEVLSTLRDAALSLQRRVGDLRQPQE
jgi:2-oxoglutarate ferredoxin oxidoreductase subunit alpha